MDYRQKKWLPRSNSQDLERQFSLLREFSLLQQNFQVDLTSFVEAYEQERELRFELEQENRSLRNKCDAQQKLLGKKNKDLFRKETNPSLQNKCVELQRLLHKSNKTIQVLSQEINSSQAQNVRLQQQVSVLSDSMTEQFNSSDIQISSLIATHEEEREQWTKTCEELKSIKQELEDKTEIQNSSSRDSDRKIVQKDYILIARILGDSDLFVDPMELDRCDEAQVKEKRKDSLLKAMLECLKIWIQRNEPTGRNLIDLLKYNRFEKKMVQELEQHFTNPHSNVYS